MRLLLFLLFCVGTVHAQVITGHVVNAADGQPLEGASVYLDGTTLSTSTNAEGFFRIAPPQQFAASLVVSYMGFDTHRVADPYKTGQPLTIAMVPNAVNLDEVTVTRKPQAFKRADMLAAFREQFVGTSTAAKSCVILNENDIYFTYDVSRNALKATADKPILMRNARLEYDISFELHGFEVVYKKKSLDFNDVLGTSFAGYTLFRDRSRNGTAVKIRQEAYYGSAAHLLKTLRNDTWEKSRMRLYSGSFPVSPADCLEFNDSGTLKKIKVLKEAKDDYNARYAHFGQKQPYKLSMLDDNGRSSFFIFKRDEFYVDRNGKTAPLDALMFGGYIGSLKAGDMLPADYVYYE